MTAKEEAKKMIDKYLDLPIDFPYIDSEDGYCIGSGYMTHKSAKKCALIDIENTIEALETYDDMTEKHLKREFPNYLSCELQNMEQDFRYYQKVKQEIEKL